MKILKVLVGPFCSQNRAAILYTLFTLQSYSSNLPSVASGATSRSLMDSLRAPLWCWALSALKSLMLDLMLP